MYVRDGRPAFTRPYVGVHRSTSLMSSSLLLHQCPACLVRLTWIVFVMGGNWPYSWCLVGCCRQDRWIKGCILPFPKKGDLGLAKNYRGIMLTSLAAKIYNALLRNRIEPKIDNILRKNQNGFRRNRSTSSQILTIGRILEGVRAKNILATILFVDFTKAFDSIHRGMME